MSSTIEQELCELNEVIRSKHQLIVNNWVGKPIPLLGSEYSELWSGPERFDPCCMLRMRSDAELIKACRARVAALDAKLLAATAAGPEAGRGGSKAGFVFDMDGTLLDSEPIHMKAWQQAITDCGGNGADLVEEDFVKWIGVPDAVAFASWMIANLGGGLEGTAPAELASRKAELFVAVASTTAAKIFDGVPEAVSEVRDAGFPVHLCTGSLGPACTALVADSTLEPFFPAEARTTNDDVTESKPAAEPYLLSARKLGVDPAASVAFEDSSSGCKSATAAGFKYRMGIKTSATEAALRAAGATHVFDTTPEAVRWALAEMGAGGEAVGSGKES